jgi:hypothetical protein
MDRSILSHLTHEKVRWPCSRQGIPGQFYCDGQPTVDLEPGSEDVVVSGPITAADSDEVDVTGKWCIFLGGMDRSILSHLTHAVDLEPGSEDVVVSGIFRESGVTGSSDPFPQGK